MLSYLENDSLMFFLGVLVDSVKLELRLDPERIVAIRTELALCVDPRSASARQVSGCCCPGDWTGPPVALFSSGAWLPAALFSSGARLPAALSSSQWSAALCRFI